MTKAGRVRNWNILYKANKKLDNEFQLKGYDMKANPTSYLLTIKGVQGIPQQDVMAGGA